MDPLSKLTFQNSSSPYSEVVNGRRRRIIAGIPYSRQVQRWTLSVSISVAYDECISGCVTVSHSGSAGSVNNNYCYTSSRNAIGRNRVTWRTLNRNSAQNCPYEILVPSWIFMYVNSALINYSCYSDFSKQLELPDWKLVGSRQSYCNNSQTYFLAHPVYLSLSTPGSVNKLWLKLHSAWYQYGLFVRVQLVREERPRSLVQAQTLVIQSPLKNW